MTGWLANAAAATRFASDRPALWLPGALAQLAFLGWVPLLATVASLPDAGDIGFFVIGLVRSPPRIAALVFLLVTAFSLLCLLAAFGEAALDRASAGVIGTARESLSSATLNRFALTLVAALPVLAAAGVLALGIAVVAPGEYQSPNLTLPVVLRVLLAVWPLVLTVLLVLVACQAIGGVAAFLVSMPRPRPVLSALADAVRDVARRPGRRLATAGAAFLADLVLVVLALALLRVLWAPIAFELRLGGLASPSTLLLLVGFVAIWMALVLAAGALRATTAAWWSLELGSPARAATGSPSAALENG